MSRKKIFQLVSLAFLVASAILSVPITEWHNKNSLVAFISLVLGIIGSVISIFIPTNYTLFFTADNFIKNYDGSNSMSLPIKVSTHGQGPSPIVQVFISDDQETGSYQIIETSVLHDKEGNVTIEINNVWDSYVMKGKVVIS